MRNYPPEPWTSDPETLDPEGYEVIRADDGAPVVYLERTLSKEARNRVAAMITGAPDLLMAVQEVMFARSFGKEWTERDWSNWTERHGPTVARCMGMMP